MSKQTKSPRKMKPFAMKLTVRQRADGRLAVGYEGRDPRTPEFGPFVLKAVMDALNK